VVGYERDDYIDRAYYVELWIEKSTIDDKLMPLAQQLGITFAASKGFQSISSAVQLLQRVNERAKPTRVFYISDHDEAGNGMPIAVSRHVEFLLRRGYAPGADVKLMPLALTSEQIARYKLPSTVNGKGKKIVELDALEALIPEELEKIVRQAVEPYMDATIGDRREAARKEAKRIVRKEWSRTMRPHERKLRALQESVESVAKKYQREADDLNGRMAKDLARFKEPLARLRSDVEKASAEFKPKLPTRPTEACEPDEGEPLFSSSRGYTTQLSFYKAHRKGS
jgi:hypothetical protein